MDTPEDHAKHLHAIAFNAVRNFGALEDATRARDARVRADAWAECARTLDRMALNQAANTLRKAARDLGVIAP